ncbi:GUN4 domain-containing protein [Calothrix sp. NIES-2098]|uniref:GUN4 domain-containing protein n=1 Tax=Calothrix sp. NIES-2098 TaxID=1954171 RepID=UPI000B5F1171|nr:serine/threonine kinase [Calothrix sp. NIES-2098]
MEKIPSSNIKTITIKPGYRPQAPDIYIDADIYLFTQLYVPNLPMQWTPNQSLHYTRLRDLLAAGEWKEADEETARVILAIAGRENEGWLDLEHIENFPCEDLCTIDELWVKHSNGHFGFSVQKRIYQSLGGTVGTREHNSKIWQAFIDSVGWRKEGKWMYYNDLTFDLTAPVAHLPYGLYLLTFIGGFWVKWWWVLFSRIETCKL